MAKRKPKGNTIAVLNTGKMFREKMEELHINKAELARGMQRAQSCINPILRQTSNQAYLIWETSVAMKFNFFQQLADLLESTAGQSLQGSNPQKLRMAELEQENKSLRQELDYLKKMVDILSQQKQ